MKYLKKFIIASLMTSLLIGIISNLFFPIDFHKTLIIIAMCLLIGFCWSKFKTWSESLSQNRITTIIYGTTILILTIQLLILYFFPVTIYHDPFRVLHEAELLSHNQADWDNSTYFWRYPNNVPLTFLLSLWLKLTSIIQLSTNVSIHILSLICLDSFVFLSMKTCQIIGKHSYQVIGLAFFFLISPFSYTYYLQVFYSDLPILLVLLLTLNLLARWPKKKILQVITVFFLFLVILIGQLIKANLIVMSIAVLLLIVDLYFHKKRALRKLVVPLVIILLAFGASFPVNQVIDSAIGFKTNSRYQFPLTHWVYMSYNAGTHGMYSSHDVNKLISLPSKKARQIYLDKALPQRLNQLGVIRILSQWVVKIGILLNVSDLQTSYTGGFIQISGFYINWQKSFHILSQSIMRTGFICLYLIGLINCSAFFKKHGEIEPFQELAITTAIGYLAFHMLFWEVESRYGQVLLPLLLIINSLPVKKVESKLSKKTLFMFGIIISLAIIFINLFNAQRTGKQIVAAQRSQLSIQYHAKESFVNPSSVVSQKLNLNHEVSTFSVAVLKKSQLKGLLINQKNMKVYPLEYSTKSGSYSLKYHGHVSAGKYQIVLKNTQNKIQPVVLTRTINYYLAPYPVFLNNHFLRFSSLVYKAICN